MYQNIYLDSYRRTIHLWDDKKGYVTFPYKPYVMSKIQMELTFLYMVTD